MEVCGAVADFQGSYYGTKAAVPWLIEVFSHTEISAHQLLVVA
jgi:hypothetical protein